MTYPRIRSHGRSSTISIFSRTRRRSSCSRRGNGAKGVSKDALEGEIKLTSYAGKEFSLFILVEKTGDKYDTVSFYSKREAGAKITSAQTGKWTDWIPVAFEDIPSQRGKTLCKVLKLAPDATELRLFFTAIMPQTGYSQPEELALELAENVPGAFLQGPPIGAMEGGWIDPVTFYEVAHFQADWYAAASIYLLKKEKWDLYFIQTHAVDHCQHSWLNKADPHTAPSKEVSEEYMGYIKKVYQASDKIIGRVVEENARTRTRWWL